jgi:hypothetical protein
LVLLLIKLFVNDDEQSGLSAILKSFSASIIAMLQGIVVNDEDRFCE